jgi:hypothetical protein
VVPPRISKQKAAQERRKQKLAAQKAATLPPTSK